MDYNAIKKSFGGDVMRDEDFKWFLKEYDNLFKKYGHKFLAIKNKTILGVFDNFKKAIDETAKKYQLGTFIVQECDGTPSAYTSSIVTIGVVKGK